MPNSNSIAQSYRIVCLTFLASTLLLGGCKKYEDGPGISFKSRTKRLYKSWVVEEVYVDGADVTAQYMDLPYHYWFWSFQDNESVDQTTCRVHANGVSYGERFFFTIEDSFETLSFNSTLMDTPANDPTWNGFDYHMVGNPYANWEITELKTKRLGLRSSANGTTIELKFKNYIW